MASGKSPRHKGRHPIAFLSYAHADDAGGVWDISQFRGGLESEIHRQTGKPFSIFQDRRDIAWGQSWRQRIVRALDATTFLIAFISPSFFASGECKKELKRFNKREKKLKRNDLILPVYYVTIPALENKRKPTKNKLVGVIASRQYADWRRLRLMGFSTKTVKKALADLASHIRDALRHRKGPRRKK
jgi:F-box protein 11